MATPVKYPRNAHVDEIIRIPIGTALNDVTYIPIQAFKKMITVNVKKGGELVLIEFANQTRKRDVAAGDVVARPITDLEDSEIVWSDAEASAGAGTTDDFFGGDSAGITGVKITVKTSPGPTTANIDISILGYDRV